MIVNTNREKAGPNAMNAQPKNTARVILDEQLLLHSQQSNTNTPNTNNA